MNNLLPSKISSLRAGAAALLPIYPETLDDVVRLARIAIISGMIKPLEKGYGNDRKVEPPDAMEARATMIIMQGMELGIPPMQAIQLLAMINGRIVAHSEAVPGLLLSKGFKIKQESIGEPYADDFKARATLTRPDGQVFVGEFTVRQAKKAGLWSPEGKITKKGRDGPYQIDNDSPWHKYPDRMLWARALGFAAKDGGADAMKGIPIREEVEDIIRSRSAIDITPAARPATRAAAPADDIPEVPDEPQAQAATPAEPTQDAGIDDAFGFLEKFHDDLDGITDKATRHEIWEANFHIIERLNDPDRRIAEAIFEGRRK